MIVAARWVLVVLKLTVGFVVSVIGLPAMKFLMFGVASTRLSPRAPRCERAATLACLRWTMFLLP